MIFEIKNIRCKYEEMLIINILDWRKTQNKHPGWKLLRIIEIIKTLNIFVQIDKIIAGKLIILF